jgi:hypothetical protein
MTDISIDTVDSIDGAEAEVTETQTEGAMPEGDEQDDASVEDGEVSEDDATESVDKEMKTIKKALNKKNRYIDNLRTKNRALEAEMQELRSRVQTQKPAPQMEQFDSVLDYVKADSAHMMEQRFTEQLNQQQLQALERQQAEVINSQAAEIEKDYTEIQKIDPQAGALLQQAIPVLGAMPPNLKNMVLELDNAAAAIYALSKEGRLQDVAQMNPYVAAAELVQAQTRGIQYLEKVSPQKQPPKPLDGLKGRGTATGKPLEQRSPDELLKWLNA